MEVGHDEAVEIIGTYRDEIYHAADVRPDNRPPLPHITIARLQRKLPPQEREAIKDWVATVNPPKLEMMAQRPALYTWSDNRKERLFKIIS